MCQLFKLPRLRLLTAVLLLILIGYSAATPAQLAETVWVGADDSGNHIYYSQYQADQWVDFVQPIYSANNSIVTPFLTTDYDGSKLLLWSESRGSSRMVLMFMRGQLSGVANQQQSITWSAPTVFADKRAFNISAIAVRDGIERLWVFWVGDDGKDSDILQSVRAGGGWSEPVLAHPDSDQPELRPIAKLDADGHLELSWSSYDRGSSSYRQKSKRILPQGLSNKEVSKQQLLTLIEKMAALDEVSPAQVKAPSRIPLYQLVRMHFPGNLQQQFANIRE